MKTSYWLVLCGFVCLGMSGLSAAEDEKAPQPILDQAALMKAWMESATPGKPHAELAKMAGEWKAACEHYMPGADMEKSTATAKRTMIMGGRFLQEEFKGNFAGTPFEGLMILGYDNNLKKYNSMWCDSMGTGMIFSSGSSDSPGSMTSKGSMYCPMHKKVMPCKMVTKTVDEDHETFELYGPGPDEKEMLMMRIHYTRQK